MMAPETVTPAMFFGEDREIAVAATGFEEALAGLIEDHEVVRESVPGLSCRSGISLPGYYRPTVRWPVGVYSRSVLAGVVWAMTEPWPFLAKDFDLIATAAVSSATDLQRAFQQGMIGETKPLACCYICVEDCPESRLTGPAVDRAGVIDPAFAGMSYLGSYEAFCHRLLDSGLYDAACFSTRTRTDHGVRVGYPAPRLSFTTLLSKISDHGSRLPE
jgi:hypothetical protein